MKRLSAWGLMGTALIFGVSATGAIAAPVAETEAIAQTTPTATEQPLDVPPTHWAYTAVQRLVNEYGCITGYPDGTFRGEQELTRYEFAAAMNACLDTLVQLIQVNRTQSETTEVLATQQDLQQQLFCLEADVTELEAGAATEVCAD
ncbi:iron uptake porin [Sphaerothrix gracilis]|uniref:iron uptake porin n=1 Tax=Sphaerothrix gracilis TaxID=3151835 RepID=UPI0031FC00ED